MSRMKAMLISAYTLIIILFIAAIFYYGWKENKRDRLEKDIFAEEEKEPEVIELEEGQEGKETSNSTNSEKQQDIWTEEQKTEDDIKEQEESMAAVVNKATIDKDTLYQLEIYDTYTQELTIKEGKLPPEFIGMTRKELEQYWIDYTADLPLQEFEKGLLSCELTSFSDKQITVRKTYDSSELKYKYYMILEQGCITVYYSDKKTVYEHTDILQEDLPEEEIEKLKHGVYVEDEESLYSILESYTS